MDGTKIKAWRESEGMTLDQLAEEISAELTRRKTPPTKISKQSISYWENDNYKPNVFMLEWLFTNAQNERVKRYARLVLSLLEHEALQAWMEK